MALGGPAGPLRGSTPDHPAQSSPRCDFCHHGFIWPVPELRTKGPRRWDLHASLPPLLLDVRLLPETEQARGLWSEVQSLWVSLSPEHRMDLKLKQDGSIGTPPTLCAPNKQELSPSCDGALKTAPL